MSNTDYRKPFTFPYFKSNAKLERIYTSKIDGKTVEVKVFEAGRQSDKLIYQTINVKGNTVEVAVEGF